MEPETGVQRPRVTVMVVLNLVGGVLRLFAGLAILSVGKQLAASVAFPLWEVYLFIALGGLAILAAVLIMGYKRAGVYFAGIASGIGVLENVYSTLSSGSFSIIGMIIDIAVLYYVFIYLTRTPDKTFFS